MLTKHISLARLSLLSFTSLALGACALPSHNCRVDTRWDPDLKMCIPDCGTPEHPTYDNCYVDGSYVGSDASEAGADAVTDTGVAPRDTGVPTPDAAMEAGPMCASPTVLCGGTCVMTDSDLAHCGGCDRRCTTMVANARATCAMGTCDVACDAGFESVGANCEPRIPRPIAPMTSATVTSQRPTLEWELPSGVTAASVDVCRDRAMTMGCVSLMATGTRVRPTSALTAGVWFWRVRGRVGGVIGARTSPVWWFRVGARSADGDRDTSWGSELDVNGDGYADVAVGAPRAEGLGRVDVFLGRSAGIAMSPDVSLRGAAIGDYFGRSVSSAGDLNGDGYVDLVVGADGEDPSRRMDAGTASVFYGGALGLSTRASLVLEGTNAGDGFGWSVSGAGDLNHDGFSDLIVGAPLADRAAGADAGVVSVYYGGPTGLAMVPGRVLVGTLDSRFGFSVSSAGDVNADGFAEIVVGANGDGLAGPMAGAVAIFHGSSSGIPALPSLVLPGREGWFGFTVSGAGDANGDGFADIAAGELLDSPGGRVSAGSVSIFHGSAAGVAASAARRLEGMSAGDYFGSSVSWAGDTNADGFTDLVVGAASASRGPFTANGLALVFFGRASGLESVAARIFEGAASEDVLGQSVRGVGDTNGDGFSDFAIGAPGVDITGNPNLGTVGVFHGTSGALPAAPFRLLHGSTVNERFGDSIARRGRLRCVHCCT